MPASPDCGSYTKLCGKRCIPKDHHCHQGSGGNSAAQRGSVAIKDLQQNQDGSVNYRGESWKIDEPKPSQRKNKKMKVLAKKGDRVKVVHFGHSGYQDFTQHGDKNRRTNYLTRSAGIRNKQGELTANDPWSPNYWSRNYLWPVREHEDALPPGMSYDFLQGMRSVR